MKRFLSYFHLWNDLRAAQRLSSPLIALLSLAVFLSSLLEDLFSSGQLSVAVFQMVVFTHAILVGRYAWPCFVFGKGIPNLPRRKLKSGIVFIADSLVVLGGMSLLAIVSHGAIRSCGSVFTGVLLPLTLGMMVGWGLALAITLPLWTRPLKSKLLNTSFVLIGCMLVFWPLRILGSETGLLCMLQSALILVLSPVIPYSHQRSSCQSSSGSTPSVDSAKTKRPTFFNRIRLSVLRSQMLFRSHGKRHSASLVLAMLFQQSIVIVVAVAAMVLSAASSQDVFRAENMVFSSLLTVFFISMSQQTSLFRKPLESSFPSLMGMSRREWARSCVCHRSLIWGVQSLVVAVSLTLIAVGMDRSNLIQIPWPEWLGRAFLWYGLFLALSGQLRVLRYGHFPALRLQGNFRRTWNLNRWMGGWLALPILVITTFGLANMLANHPQLNLFSIPSW
ncbi:MAG: hypothetical protein JW706_06805, partial [Opitutales bacterium]|nr:hypothetical protein [Opitutales bacterium]